MLSIKSSNETPLHGVAITCQGGRTENQDDVGFYETPLGLLFIVCDGMGGGPGGKTASYMAKNEISQTLINCNPKMSPAKAVKAAIGIAQEAIAAKSEEVSSVSGMGTTTVVLLINKYSAIIAHAGDSRCYQLRGKRLAFRTQDHSLVEELVQRKVFTEEEARTSPQSNIIKRGLGCLSNNVPDVVEVPYKKGDRFVLCTDGVWGIMPHQELIKRFTSKEEIKTVLSNLAIEIDELGVRSGGHHDNHTAAMIEMESDSLLKEEKFIKKKSFIAVAVAVVIMMSISIWLIIHYFIN